MRIPRVRRAQRLAVAPQVAVLLRRGRLHAIVTIMDLVGPPLPMEPGPGREDLRSRVRQPSAFGAEGVAAAALAAARQGPCVSIGARWGSGRGRAGRGVGARLEARDEPRAVPVVLDADLGVRARHANERGFRVLTQVGGHPLPIQQVPRQGARHARRPTGQIVQEVDHHHGRCVRVRLVQLEERAFNGQRVARRLSHAIASARSRGVSCACSG